MGNEIVHDHDGPGTPASDPGLGPADDAAEGRSEEGHPVLIQEPIRPAPGDVGGRPPPAERSDRVDQGHGGIADRVLALIHLGPAGKEKGRVLPGKGNQLDPMAPGQLPRQDRGVLRDAAAHGPGDPDENEGQGIRSGRGRKPASFAAGHSRLTPPPSRSGGRAPRRRRGEWRLPALPGPGRWRAAARTAP